MIEKYDLQITALLKHQISMALYCAPKEAKKYLLEAGTQEALQDNLPMTATQKVKKLKDRYGRLQENDEGKMVLKTNVW